MKRSCDGIVEYRVTTAEMSVKKGTCRVPHPLPQTVVCCSQRPHEGARHTCRKQTTRKAQNGAQLIFVEKQTTADGGGLDER